MRKSRTTKRSSRERIDLSKSIFVGSGSMTFRHLALAGVLVAGIHGQSARLPTGSTTSFAADRPGVPSVGAWGALASLLEANSEMSVAELNDNIYVLGGYPSARVSVPTVQVYEPTENR